HELPERGRLVLGRGQDCDVRIDHSSVSRRHVAIIVGDDGYAIEDLGSSNGTRVDDRKLGAGETMRFEPQCQIRLGATTVILPQRNAEGLGPNVVAELSPVPHGPAMAALHEQIELVARGKIAVLI